MSSGEPSHSRKKKTLAGTIQGKTQRPDVSGKKTTLKKLRVEKERKRRLRWGTATSKDIKQGKGSEWSKNGHKKGTTEPEARRGH